MAADVIEGALEKAFAHTAVQVDAGVTERARAQTDRSAPRSFKSSSLEG